MNMPKTASINRNNKTLQLVAAGAAVLAVAIHGYLLKSHYDLRYGEVTGQLLCDISAKFSCSAASASSWSELLGVPLALWGMLANLAYLAFAGWDLVAEESERGGNRTSIFAVTGSLVLASVVMAVVSIALLETICPFCFLTYALSLVTGIGAYLGYKEGWVPKFQMSFIWVTVAFAVSAFILNDQFRSGYSDNQGQAMAKAAVLEWNQNPKVEISNADPLILGADSEKAKMVITEFADFRCIHCKLASAPIKAFVNAHSDVRLEFYAWPLDGECNTSIQQPNGASCLLARTVWCARKNGEKGWETHDAIFERFEEWKSAEKIRSSLDSIATQVGVEAAKLKECADSTEAKAAVEAQARLGSGLSLRGTPAIFVNGKLLPAGSSITVLNAVRKSIK